METKMRRIGNETEEDRMLNELFVAPVRTSFLEVGEDKFVIPIYYEEVREKINKFEVRDDDIFVTGHPKTGTTWLYEMIQLIASDLDYEAAKVHVSERLYFLDSSFFYDNKKIMEDLKLDHGMDIIKTLNELKSPRCIKTHLNWPLLPEQIQNGTKKPKIIHILRNPKDSCVSYYHNSKLMDGYVGGFEDFCKLFMAGRLNYSPFFPTILSYWKERERSNVLILKYKDMKKDLPGIIKQTAEFLGKSFTEEQIKKLAQHLSFESMKNNPALDMKPIVESFFKFYGLTTKNNDFIRAGKEGGYKSEMSPEISEKFDSWTQTNLAGTGLSF